jgi:monofunctional glycosyltransferase
MARIIPEPRLTGRQRRVRGRAPRPRRRRWLRLLAVLLLAPVLASVLVVALLRVVDPPTSAFMLQRWIEARSGPATLAIDYRWRDWPALSPELLIALVAAEDQHFPTHSGFDLKAIESVLDRGGAPSRGASTISQQVAKNLFLWPARSWLRKGLEAWFTLLIEGLWPKQRILEVYANIAEFGDGIYGAEAAAQRFFGRPAAALGRSESARLAAVLPNPRRFSAAAPSPYVQKRAQWIERQARQLGGPAYLDRCCRSGAGQAAASAVQ